jgi:hypothetical protein
MAITAIIAIGSMLLQDTQAVISGEIHIGQAVSISTAGLVEGLSWFRHQTAQPVTAFQPKRDMEASPPVNETDDPTIGIVREFEISHTNGLWGRYEVRLTNVDSSGRAYPVVRDISVERNLVQADPPLPNGGAWHLESTGTIFKKANSATYQTTSFYRPGFPPYIPNRTVVQTPLGPRPYVTIVTSAVTCTEVRRMIVLPPAGGGALCSRRGANAVLGARSRVVGDKKPGLAYPKNTGDPSTAGELTGSPAKYVVDPPTDYADSVSDVFGGMDKNDLRTTADIYAESITALPTVLPEYSLVYFKGAPTFNASRSLRGTGILFVEGDLTIDYDSNSFYSGIIYVEGNYVQRSPSMVKGLVIVTGAATLEGIGDLAELDYDSNICNQVLLFMGQYRFSKPMTFVRTAD